MRNYETTFIVDPVLSGDEIKATAQTYVDLLTAEGCTIVHTDEMGLRQLAYAINKRTSGVYYSIEFTTPTGEMISKVELAFRRDERIMRFLTVKLDKYGVKYNEDKRNGLIGKRRTEEEDKKDNKGGRKEAPKRRENRSAPKPTTTSAPAPTTTSAPAPTTTSAPAPTETATAVAEEEE